MRTGRKGGGRDDRGRGRRRRPHGVRYRANDPRRDRLAAVTPMVLHVLANSRRDFPPYLDEIRPEGAPHSQNFTARSC